MQSVRTFGVREPGIDYVPRPGVYALAARDDGRFAFVQGGVGALFLPGGGSERGETQLMTLAREIDEECGLAAEIFEHVCDAVQYVRVTEARGVKIDASYFRAHLDASRPPKAGMVWLSLGEALPALAREADAWALSLILRRSSAAL